MFNNILYSAFLCSVVSGLVLACVQQYCSMASFRLACVQKFSNWLGWNDMVIGERAKRARHSQVCSIENRGYIYILYIVRAIRAIFVLITRKEGGA